VGSRLPRLHCRVTSQGDREQRTAVSCKAVHSINFDSQPDSSELATILGACTGLRTLVLNAAPEPRLLALNHLCRLEIVARGILSIDHNNQLDFPCVSHLELLASRERSSGISHLQLPKTYLALRRFPQLTHLALSMLPVKPVVEMIQKAEAEVPLRLECIVFLLGRSLALDKAPFPTHLSSCRCPHRQP
jgi:hypothetical protein